jgi:hypothetical protein
MTELDERFPDPAEVVRERFESVTPTLRVLPRGPVMDQVIKLCGTETPRRSSTWNTAGEGRGYIFTGDGDRACTVTQPDAGRWVVRWRHRGRERSAEFIATVTWKSQEAK